MYAIVQTGGKQYKAAVGDVISVEKLDAEVGTEVTFDVLLVADGENVTVGTPVVEGVKAECQLKELKKYVEILNDPGIPYDNDYEIGYSYFTGDRAVQQRNDYAFTVALCSDRHPSYESINGSNRFSWYAGDGALYLSTNTF